MADLPFDPTASAAAQLLPAVDPDGKVLRAIEALGPVAGTDVVLLGCAPVRERELVERVGRLVVVDLAPADTPAAPARRAAHAAHAGPAGPDAPHVTGSAAATGLPDASADVVIAHYSALQRPDRAAVLEADRLLRPDGRLLIVADYGRDDLDALRTIEGRRALIQASRRDGWFLGSGFRIRVIHAWWTFDDLDAASSVLHEAFGAKADELVAGLRRPRLAQKVAIYHRTRGAGNPAVEAWTGDAPGRDGPGDAAPADVVPGSDPQGDVGPGPGTPGFGATGGGGPPGAGSATLR